MLGLFFLRERAASEYLTRDDKVKIGSKIYTNVIFELGDFGVF